MQLPSSQLTLDALVDAEGDDAKCQVIRQKIFPASTPTSRSGDAIVSADLTTPQTRERLEVLL
jgi:hypothetical protein